MKTQFVIPEGYEAKIEGNTVILERKESEEQMEALMLAIEGKWEGIKPTGYMSRRLEDLYEGLANTFTSEKQRGKLRPRDIDKLARKLQKKIQEESK